MKSAIHPTYYPSAKITCACGNTLEVGSTVEAFETELCNKCHPFYSGKQKIVDTARRVEKFAQRMKNKAEKTVTKKEKKARVRAKKEERGATAQKES